MTNYAHAVLDVLRGERDFLRARWGNAGSTRQKGESPHSIATQTDVDVETHLRVALTKLYPDVGFFGEEGGGTRSERFWLVDPIDGTSLFARGERGCASMLALIEQEIVTFSAIYDFVDDVVYSATRGLGAFRNGERISVSARGTLEGARIFCEMNLDNSNTKALFDRVSTVARIAPSGPAGLQLVGVATGAYDARICIDPHGYDYDFAPGSLLVSEAGGIVRNIGAASYDYRNLNFIAGSPIVYEELRKIVSTPTE